MGIIKRDSLKHAGVKQLGGGEAPPPPEPSSSETPPARDEASGPQARIVEQAGGQVLVEVQCSCGQRIYLQCDESDADAETKESEG